LQGGTLEALRRRSCCDEKNRAGNPLMMRQVETSIAPFGTVR
jgi:hypothetical protein